MRPEEIKADIEKANRTRKLIKYGPLAVSIAFALLAFHGGLISLLFFGAIGWGMSKLVGRFVADPLYHASLRKIRDKVAALINNKVPGPNLFQWYLPHPGAVKIGDDDRVAVIGQCTGFQSVIVEPHQICKATVQTSQQTIAQTRNSGSTGIAIPVGKFAIGHSFGSRSQTTYHTVEEHWVELMWQEERNRPPSVCVIPYRKRVDAESFVILIERMLAQPALAQAKAAEQPVLS